jgi:hypothetical protein
MHPGRDTATGFDFLLRPPYKGIADALVKFLSR